VLRCPARHGGDPAEPAARPARAPHERSRAKPFARPEGPPPVLGDRAARDGPVAAARVRDAGQHDRGRPQPHAGGGVVHEDGLAQHDYGEPAAPRARDPPLRAAPPRGDSAPAGLVRVDEAGHLGREPGRAHGPTGRGMAARDPRDVGDHGSRPVGRGERPRYVQHCLGELLAPNGRRAPGSWEGGEAASPCTA